MICQIADTLLPLRGYKQPGSLFASVAFQGKSRYESYIVPKSAVAKGTPAVQRMLVMTLSNCFLHYLRCRTATPSCWCLTGRKASPHWQVMRQNTQAVWSVMSYCSPCVKSSTAEAMPRDQAEGGAEVGVGAEGGAEAEAGEQKILA